jgi:signal transduction histidine kinase
MTASPDPDGSGFGLFSIRERLKPFEGYIRLESRLSGGTRAVLEMPVTLNVIELPKEGS